MERLGQALNRVTLTKGWMMKKKIFRRIGVVLLTASLMTISLDSFGAPPKNAQTRKREKVVESMRAMATVPWTPSEDLTYWVPKYGVMFKAGESYEGLPYTQRNRETTLEIFQENLDQDGRYIGPADYYGTDCSSSVSIAWREVDKDLPCLSTYFMFPGMGKIVTVGDYKVTSTQSTPKIILDNGEEKIRDCYDKLRPGDVILWRNEGFGHVRLVSALDPERETIYIIEQTGAGKDGLKGKKGTWRIDYAFSYDQMIEDGYVPITHKALLE